MAWSAQQYLKFEDERTRPARDLLHAVPTPEVRRAVDLGCGPGNSTELILSRFPDAAVTGVDNSESMIAEARRRLPQVPFERQDIATWDDAGPWDLIFANAVLQWVPGHDTLLPRLAARLSAGGSLAVQMPDNLGEPSHVAMRTAAAAVPFAEKLGAAAAARTLLPDAGWYYGLLKPHCRRVDLWRTTYYHPLAGGVSAIVEWVRGTGLIPFLKPLGEAEQSLYLRVYEAELAKVYKPLEDGSVILPFPRLFIVAIR
jgi:trans-aconitate 2-methyltransferase